MSAEGRSASTRELAPMGEVAQVPEDTPSDSSPGELLAHNRAWAESKMRVDPTFFSPLVGQQGPQYFWIGCSDSRVPATEIVDLDPDEMLKIGRASCRERVCQDV